MNEELKVISRCETELQNGKLGMLLTLFLAYLDMRMQMLALNMYNLGTCVDFLQVSVIISIY